MRLADEQAPVPTIGVIGRGYVHRNVSITREFSAFKVPESFSDTFVAKFYDFDLYATGSINRNLAVQGGYRRVSANYVIDDDTGDLKLKGLTSAAWCGYKKPGLVFVSTLRKLNPVSFFRHQQHRAADGIGTRRASASARTSQVSAALIGAGGTAMSESIRCWRTRRSSRCDSRTA